MKTLDAWILILAEWTDIVLNNQLRLKSVKKFAEKEPGLKVVVISVFLTVLFEHGFILQRFQLWCISTL